MLRHPLFLTAMRLPNSISILIIDDHQLVLDGIVSMLSDSPEIVVEQTFTHPQKALDYIENHNVDLVITDLDMPSMSGSDVLMFLKAKFPKLPVAILSMHNEKSVIQHLIDLGADGYLIKTLGKEEFVSGIKLMVSGKKYFSSGVTESLIQQTEDYTNKFVEGLTSREIEILKLIAEGLSSKEIGENLFISHRTVETHRNNLQKKLNVKNVVGLVKVAYDAKLI